MNEFNAYLPRFWTTEGLLSVQLVAKGKPAKLSRSKESPAWQWVAKTMSGVISSGALLVMPATAAIAAPLDSVAIYTVAGQHSNAPVRWDTNGDVMRPGYLEALKSALRSAEILPELSGEDPEVLI